MCNVLLKLSESQYCIKVAKLEQNRHNLQASKKNSIPG